MRVKDLIKDLGRFNGDLEVVIADDKKLIYIDELKEVTGYCYDDVSETRRPMVVITSSEYDVDGVCPELDCIDSPLE